MQKSSNLEQSSEISSFTQSKPESSFQYDQNFDSYEETKKLESVSYKDDFESESHLSSFAKLKTNGFRNHEESYPGDSLGESMPRNQIEDSRLIKGVQPLHTIQEETNPKPKNTNQSRTNSKPQPKQKQKQKQTHKPVLNQKVKLKLAMSSDQKHLPYNFNKLKEMEKERVLTDLMEENGAHKQSIRGLEEELKKERVKYAKLLEQKVGGGDDSKERALLKENEALRMRIQSLLQFKKTHDHNNTFKALSVPEQKPTNLQEEKIREELISVIDKLKKRLRESEEQMKVLQRKLELSQQLDLQQSLSSKTRQLQKLQYKIAQLSDQAETDRLFIDELKQKSERTQSLLKEQRDKYSKLTKQFRGIQLKISTNNDLVHQLAETKKERDSLQKSLRELSATLVTKVESRNQEQRKELQALGYIEVMDFGS